MKILELFSGTESFSKVARARGHETFTVDINVGFHPDLCKDILYLSERDFLIREFHRNIRFEPIDIIWASPPCTSFSVASISSSWIGNYHPKRVETALNMAYVLKTLELIKKLKPKFWFIENPRGVLRKMAFMNNSFRKTLTYCQYGDERMKPTDIWTNLNWKPKPMCKNGDDCHISAPRGSKTGTQGRKDSVDRSKIPKELCLEIIKVCEEKWEK